MRTVEIRLACGAQKNLRPSHVVLSSMWKQNKRTSMWLEGCISMTQRNVKQNIKTKAEKATTKQQQQLWKDGMGNPRKAWNNVSLLISEWRQSRDHGLRKLRRKSSMFRLNTRAQGLFNPF